MDTTRIQPNRTISKDVSRKTDKNVYSVAVQINADVIPSHYFSSPVCYTQEELAELDKQGKIAWEKYQHPEPEPGVWIVYIPTATIDIAEYDANGSWYVYAKAENLKGTTYVSTPKLIADVEKPKAINLSTGQGTGDGWGILGRPAVQGRGRAARQGVAREIPGREY